MDSIHYFCSRKALNCAFKCTQDHWNIHRTPGDIPVWRSRVNIYQHFIYNDPRVTIYQKLKHGFILDPEVFFLQIFDSWCGIAYTFSPAIQIINPEHVPSCPQNHFSGKYSIYNRIFNVFQCRPHLKKSYSCSNALEKFKKYGKLLPIYSKNVLQILLSQLSLALAKWIFEVVGLWAPFGLFRPILRLKLQNMAWPDVPN
jgi:hypothetical protein